MAPHSLFVAASIRALLRMSVLALRIWATESDDRQGWEMPNVLVFSPHRQGFEGQFG
jgi:hypothetical protein